MEKLFKLLIIQLILRCDINTDFNMNDATIAKEAATSDTVRQNIYTCIDNSTNIAPITIRQQDLRKFIDLNTGKNLFKYLQLMDILVRQLLRALNMIMK